VLAVQALAQETYLADFTARPIEQTRILRLSRQVYIYIYLHEKKKEEGGKRERERERERDAYAPRFLNTIEGNLLGRFYGAPN